MSSTSRKEINSKLIDLVKPHELLYNLKYANHQYFVDRQELWNGIAAEMNRTFSLKLRKKFAKFANSIDNLN